MKIKIKNFNGELPSYLTVGKVYRVGGRRGNNELLLRDDNNQKIYVRITDNIHLNGGSWEVVDIKDEKE